MVLDVTQEDEIRSLTYVIQNIVVKTSLNIKHDFDLKKISEGVTNTDYNPERFPGLFLRFKYPKCVIIIFRNGKLILTGLKSFDHIDLVIKRLILTLKDRFGIYIDNNPIHTKVVNIVITANFHKQVNLDLAVIKLDNTIYEPEVFPGLIYHSFNPVKSVFLIFSTGKIVFTGVDDKSIIEPALISLGRLLNDKKLFVGS
ncbi:MAG: TATA-box-binding protein [Promethearchaeota archaeon]|nr:MAG: TATA-box-binding protein [Candidatus Lokiarchaeota archaeon]